MTTSQLEALLIDQALGELPAEIDALLNAYLEASPAHAGEVRALRDSLDESLLFTGEVVTKCPELFTPVALVRGTPGWLALLMRPRLGIVAVCLALVLAAGAGYRAGRGTAGHSSGVVVEKAEPRDASQSPWARYVVADDGRLAVVPVGRSAPEKSL